MALAPDSTRSAVPLGRRRALALVQLVGLAVALGAMFAPAPRTLMEKWSSFTIYPWWALVLVAIGAAAAALSVALPSRSHLLSGSAGVTGVAAAQIGGLGIWAQKHWLPAFGFGGTYTGDVEELERLAWVVAAGGVLAALAAVGQLVVQRDWPCEVPSAERVRRIAVGLAVLVFLPFLLALTSQFLTDRNSLVALALIYSIPWGLSLAAAGWLSREATLGVLALSFVSATLCAVAPSGQITLGEGQPVFAAAALLFLVLLVVERRPEKTRALGSGYGPRP